MKRILASLLVLALLLAGCTGIPDTPTDPSEPTAGGSVNATDSTEAPTDGTEIPTDGTEAPTDGTDDPTDGPDDPTDGPADPTDPDDPAGTQTDTFCAHFIDVGQADCALLKVGDCDILIDGGNVADGGDVVAYLQSQNVDDIELMICTHADEDHVGGLTDVLNSFVVEEVWTSPVSKTTKAYTNFVTAVGNEGIELTVPTVGDTYTYEDLTVTTLGPVASYSGANNASVVVMVQYGEVRFLFTGDMESDAEADLLASGADLRCDVLKVGHHGSQTSSSVDFLSAVNASYGVISVGTGNSYGHPHAAIITRLENAGMTLYRTDLLGTVLIATDGKDLFFPDGSTSSGGGFTDTDVTVTPSIPADSHITVAEALDLCAKAGTTATTGKYYISGTVTAVDNTTYGNFYLQDDTGTILIYGCYSADGTVRYDALAQPPAVGDEVTLYGVLVTYSGSSGDVPEMKNAWLMEHNGAPNEDTTADDNTGSGDSEVCFIGNVSSKKLHLPTCSSLPSEANRVYFYSYDEAIAEGYTHCQKCMKNYTP